MRPFCGVYGGADPLLDLPLLTAFAFGAMPLGRPAQERESFCSHAKNHSHKAEPLTCAPPESNLLRRIVTANVMNSLALFLS
jgi:hypothetical protein